MFDDSDGKIKESLIHVINLDEIHLFSSVGHKVYLPRRQGAHSKYSTRDGRCKVLGTPICLILSHYEVRIKFGRRYW